jgi:hypothetical protein
MESPERIHVVYNGADAVEDFRAEGLLFLPHGDVEISDITKVIGSTIGKFSSFPARRLDTHQRIIIKAMAINDPEITFWQHGYKPEFQDTYVVASEPPPHADINSDISFHLIHSPIK